MINDLLSSSQLTLTRGTLIQFDSHLLGHSCHCHDEIQIMHKTEVLKTRKIIQQIDIFRKKVSIPKMQKICIL